ncbi:MAG: hypothetical protein LBH21_07670 [Gracilibacteraceae bacterium]|jgi:hypothetical protein|nr:hypothetical protein [Gracilibacteraceae bacterium]
MNWQQICNENDEFFQGGNWAEAGEKDRKTLKLSPRFRFLSAGDMNLKTGVVVTEGQAREDDLLANGLAWANKISNGVCTRLVFVAPSFSRVFLSSLRQISGRLSLRAVLWREKLHPHFFPVNTGSVSAGPAPFFAGRVMTWETWSSKCNPVARQHLTAVRAYFDSLAGRKVRPVFRRNSIVFAWGGVSLAEVTFTGDKFDLRTKNKGRKNVIQARQGWVDADGRLDEGFCRAVQDALAWLEEREAGGGLPELSALALKMWHEPDFIGETGKPIPFPLLKKEPGGVHPRDFWYFTGANGLSVYYPILTRPLACLGEVLYYDAVLRENAQEISRWTGEAVWDDKIRIITSKKLTEELSRHQEFFQEAERFPLVILPENWRRTGKVS